MTLAKQDITDILVSTVGLNHREAKELLDAFFEEVGSALEAGESVKLARFGHFATLCKPGRPGRNPKTLEPVLITPRRVVTFYPSISLKARILAGTGGPDTFA